MTREVLVTEKAERQLHAAADWYAEQNPHVADEWFAGISAAIIDLADNAERFGLARESETLGFELRERRYGLGKRITHRILFVIRGTTILVHQVRHVAQQNITEEG